MTGIGTSITAGLPDSSRVDVGVFARLLDSRTNSYKFFFLLALLDRIEGRSASGEQSPDLDRPVPIRDLLAHMIVAAWFPHGFCRLSLGLQDRLQDAVDAIPWGPVKGSWITAGGDEWRRLHGRAIRSAEPEKLSRYVPYRLIRPFFSKETLGVPDGKVNSLVAKLADGMFDSRKPLYMFTTDRESLVLHHDWIGYLAQNGPIVRGWLLFRLAEYLQSRNPTVPGIIDKLIPPLSRSSLATHTAWWKAALPGLGRKAVCIYSGSALSLDDLSMDHHLPWSFVAHDRAWNIVPVPGRVNSSKSDCIPADRYTVPLAELQHGALAALHGLWPEGRWVKAAEPFMSDLGLGKDAILDSRKLLAAYNEVLPLAKANAGRLGFALGWEYPSC